MDNMSGVIQGFAAQAAVDASHQVIVAADVSGSGSEQAMLLPMIEQTQGVRAVHTIFTAEAGYHGKENIEAPQGSYELRVQCLRHPQRTEVRQVAMFVKGQAGARVATQLMKRAIDSARGRSVYSQRNAAVEPVFPNLRHNKRLDRFTVRGKEKVAAQWRLYCMVHNIEKLARHGCRDDRN